MKSNLSLGYFIHYSNTYAIASRHSIRNKKIDYLTLLFVILLILTIQKITSRERNKKSYLSLGYFIYYSNTYAIASLHSIRHTKLWLSDSFVCNNFDIDYPKKFNSRKE
jgi:predicted signal transduction protein with EAL and GGDEF domain